MEDNTSSTSLTPSSPSESIATEKKSDIAVGETAFSRVGARHPAKAALLAQREALKAQMKIECPEIVSKLHDFDILIAEVVLDDHSSHIKELCEKEKEREKDIAHTSAEKYDTSTIRLPMAQTYYTFVLASFESKRAEMHESFPERSWEVSMLQDCHNKASRDCLRAMLREIGQPKNREQPKDHINSFSTPAERLTHIMATFESGQSAVSSLVDQMLRKLEELHLSIDVRCTLGELLYQILLGVEECKYYHDQSVEVGNEIEIERAKQGKADVK